MYARAFDTVEIDSTFYAIPPRERFESWRERTPAGFLFTLKMPGEVTHELRLRDERLAHRFCDEARALGEKLGPILIQLPPDFSPRERPAVESFLRTLPDDLTFAIEFRDRRWFTARTRAALESTGVTLALSMGPWLAEPEARSLATRVPGPVVYLRWMGTPRHQVPATEIVQERDREMRAWSALVGDLGARTVFAYFNNDYQGHSPASARRFQRLLGHEVVAPGALTPQTELFG